MIKPDGTLELDTKLPLAPGRVQLIVQLIPELPTDDPFWQMMKRIWAEQKARGHVPRSTDEVEAERKTMRDEWDDRMQSILCLQDEAQKIREAST
jgi:hypothetical protein